MRRSPRGIRSLVLGCLLGAGGCEDFRWTELARDPIEAADTAGKGDGASRASPRSARSVPTPAARPTGAPVAGAAPPATGRRGDPEGADPTALPTAVTALDLPVAGISRGDLYDSYTEERGGGSHEALDIPAPRGTPVLSAADGRLLRIFDSRAGGLMVYATDASERFILLYGHLDGYAEGLREGMPLSRGQPLGYVGTTGNAPPGTPHLHFGILRGDPDVSWWSGDPVNPYPLLMTGRLPP